MKLLRRKMLVSLEEGEKYRVPLLGLFEPHAFEVLMKTLLRFAQ